MVTFPQGVNNRTLRVFIQESMNDGDLISHVVVVWELMVAKRAGPACIGPREKLDNLARFQKWAEKSSPIHLREGWQGNGPTRFDGSKQASPSK